VAGHDGGMRTLTCNLPKRWAARSSKRQEAKDGADGWDTLLKPIEQVPVILFTIGLLQSETNSSPCTCTTIKTHYTSIQLTISDF
jgi:hypothetical protein